MKHENFEIKSTDNRTLFAQFWAPDDGVNGVICLIHGIGEHVNRYNYWAERAVSEGLAFLGFDLCCSGRSEGKRGLMPSFNTFMDDIELLLKQAEIRFPGAPVVLYGHSMGGALVLNYAIRRSPVINGIFVTSPWLILKNKPSKFMISVVRILSEVFPNVTISAGSSSGAGNLSRDKEVVKDYLKDPLVHNRISLKMIIALQEAAAFALENASKLKLPLLLMHGSSDQITDPEGSRQFMESKKNNCTLKIWEGLYHEMYNEPEKEEVFNYLMNWINKLL